MNRADADHVAWTLWAADCAAHVLDSFTRCRPDDPRPGAAVDAARAWARGELSMKEAREAAFAAHAAARATSDDKACAAARAAGHAAATAHVAAHASHAAAYARKAADSPEREREWQDRHRPAHLRPKAPRAPSEVSLP